MNYKISRNLEYALMALSYMSERKNKCVSAKEMSQVFHCPFHPFSRVLQKMADHSLVKSRKGIGGGYILTQNLNKLSLYKIMSIVLPPLEFSACMSGHCDLLEHCNIQNPVLYLNKRLVDFYQTLNVKEILTCGSTAGFYANKSLVKTGHESKPIYNIKNNQNKEVYID